MRYNNAEKKLLISCREFVATARRGISTSLPYDSDEPEEIELRASLKKSTETAKELTYGFMLDGQAAEIKTKPLIVTDNKIHLTVAVDSSPKRPKKETVAQARGEAFIAGHILAESYGYDTVELNYLYINPLTDEENEARETVTKKKLASFFENCKKTTNVYARPEIDRVTERIPSMREVKFPYTSIRDGQSELVHSVYRNLARGGRLFAAAPTGTGKTVSVLFPAVRALGNQKCDKVFYFTPKTTTAIAAKECLSLICDKGAKIKAVIIAAKERLCKNRVVCRRGHTLCENSKTNRLADAVLELYDTGYAVVDKKELCEVAERYGVCPYELSLSYAELCDVIICDINYLFDPAVYIRRFFTEGGRFAFLIDEAHNLPERAREMYSAQITEEELISPALDEVFGEHSELKNVARGATKRFFDLLYSYLKEEMHTADDGTKTAAAHLSSVPSELYQIFGELVDAAEREIYKTIISKDEEKDIRACALRDYYYKVKRFYSTISDFDSHYELFLFYENEKIRAKCFCIDPSAQIAKRLDKGSSAVFFSGTLTPLYYYKSVLGGDGASEELLVDSPFDPSQLSVSIMDKISTRLLSREDTLGAVCRAIAATVSAKRGHYMVFSPSFAYSDALARAFSAKYPKIKVLTQTKNMSAKEKEDFFKALESEEKSYLVAFCVMGGIYSEGVDLVGDSLIGAVVVGIGIPSLSYEREAIAAYYDERYDEGKQFAYVYPGVNRVLQAAGRVIRREDDKGVVVLIDDRFDDPIYKSVIPKLWKDMKFISDPKELRCELDEFWKEE